MRQDQAEDKNLGIFIIEMEFKAPDWIQSLGSKRDRREWGVQIPGESTFHLCLQKAERTESSKGSSYISLFESLSALGRLQL